MKVEEGRGRVDRGEGLTSVWGPASEDLKHRSSVFFFPPFFTFASPHPFPLSSALLSQHHRRPEQADLSAVHQEICPEALRWAAKYRGWTVGNKRPPKTHGKYWELGKMCLMALPLKALHVWNVPKVTTKSFPPITQAELLRLIGSECGICVVEHKWANIYFILRKEQGYSLHAQT